MDHANALLIIGTLLICGHLLRGLNAKRILPLFRIYLWAFAIAAIFSWYKPLSHWSIAAVLAIKVAVTVEAMQMLYRKTPAPDRTWMAIGSTYAAVVGVAICQAFAQQQNNLTHPRLVYVKHMVQVFMAIQITYALIYVWEHRRAVGVFRLTHAALLALLWLDYAIVGMVDANQRYQWLNVQAVWYAVAAWTFSAWVCAVSQLRIPNRYLSSAEGPADPLAGEALTALSAAGRLMDNPGDAPGVF